MTMLTIVHFATTPTIRRGALVMAARLRRAFNGWVAAAIAHRERQAALSALRHLDTRELDSTRLYRSPIDQAVEKAARLRNRRRPKHS